MGMAWMVDYGTGHLVIWLVMLCIHIYCHELQYPIKVIGSSTPVMPDSAPNAEIVHLTYPERKKPKDIKINLLKFRYPGLMADLNPVS